MAKVFHCSSSSILITRMSDAEVIDLNEAFEKTFLVSRKEILGKTTSELNLLVDFEKRQDIVDRLQKGESIRNYRMRARRSSGVEFNFILSAACVTINSVESVIVIGQDMTEQNRMEKQLIESEKLELVATFFKAVFTLPNDFGLSWFTLDCRLSLTSEAVPHLNFGLGLAGE